MRQGLAFADDPGAVPDRLRIVVALRADVELEHEDGALVIGHPWGRLRLTGLDGAVAAALAQLADQGLEPAGVHGASTRMLLQRIAPALTTTLMLGERRLATATAMTADATLRWQEPVAADTQATLGQFSYLRRCDGAALLESPLSRHRVELHDASAAALVAALARRAAVSAQSAAAPALEAGAAFALVDLLAAADLVELGDEREDRTLALWDFHDLVFHSRSRLGRHDHPFGGSYRHSATHRPLAAVAARPAGAYVDLPRPQWDAVVDRDPKLTEALEGRRSIREYGAAPINLAQLGELLYRVARVRGVIEADPDNGLPYDALDRPFPTGGGSGELELYLTIARCDGIEPGVYHYDAARHGLRAVDASPDDRRELLTAAWRAAAGRVDPQVLITVTSRFGRLSWKYSSIAYALTLKHVGVLYQTLYLVATAMGLAPCALGSGNADVAARAFGLQWASESSVGEFLIGSRPAGAPPAAAGFVEPACAASGPDISCKPTVSA
jgi:SagB-type dehydrogenase family enzyme